jgi:hypothetical protein
MARPAWLTAPMRRVLPFVERGAREQLSAGAIVRAIREAGLGFRESDMRRLIREVTGRTLFDNLLRTRSPNRPPPFDQIPTALGRIRSQFSYTSQLTVLDTRTGNQSVIFRTLSTDSLLTPSEANDRISEWYQEEERRYSEELISASFHSVKRAGPAGLL